MATKAVVLGSDDVGAIVIDCGSWAIRAGCAGDDSPRCVFPTAAGIRPSTQPPSPSSSKKKHTYIAGDRLTLAPLSFGDVSSIHSVDPQTGTASIRDWDAMQAVWNAAFDSLRVSPSASSSPLMLVEPSRAWPDAYRARALELAFEGCGAPAAYVARGAAMAAFASARTTACVVDVGHQGATAVPVVEGYVLQKATQISRIGGQYLTEKLCEWVEKRLGESETSAEPGVGKDGDVEMSDTQGNGKENSAPRTSRLRALHEIRRARQPKIRAGTDVPAVRKSVLFEDLTKSAPQNGFSEAHRTFFRLRVVDDIKASLYRIGGATGEPDIEGIGNGDRANDGKGGVEENVKEAADNLKIYQLPDGNQIDLNAEGGTELASVLFENHDTDKSQCAISNLAFDAVSASDVDVRREMFNGVVLTGGTSLIPGVVERFTKELAVLTPQPYKLKVLASPNTIERTAGPWIGGSIVASLGTFQQAWISKAEYDELGCSGALRKCP